MRNPMTLIFAGLLLSIYGCEAGPDSPRGFSLPPGKADIGREVFVAQACTGCHTIHDLELPAPEEAGRVMVTIGGPVTVVKTYAELVTSIINPSHRLAPGYPLDKVSKNGTSIMPIYNDVMTVTELVDLVAFLQPRYELMPIPPTYYPGYKYQ